MRLARAWIRKGTGCHALGRGVRYGAHDDGGRGRTRSWQRGGGGRADGTRVPDDRTDERGESRVGVRAHGRGGTGVRRRGASNDDLPTTEKMGGAPSMVGERSTMAKRGEIAG
jgi:hypothetical protein